MEVIIIPKHIADISYKSYMRSVSLDDQKVCPYCNQPIKRNEKRSPL